MLQLCANSYNCAINDTSMKFHELLEDIISKYFRHRDIPDSSYFVFNQKFVLLDVTAQYTILPNFIKLIQNYIKYKIQNFYRLCKQRNSENSGTSYKEKLCFFPAL